jgi:hypothetical protein
MPLRENTVSIPTIERIYLYSPYASLVMKWLTATASTRDATTLAPWPINERVLPRAR